LVYPNRHAAIKLLVTGDEKTRADRNSTTAGPSAEEDRSDERSLSSPQNFSR
jgi:hypothetical protein